MGSVGFNCRAIEWPIAASFTQNNIERHVWSPISVALILTHLMQSINAISAS